VDRISVFGKEDDHQSSPGVRIHEQVHLVRIRRQFVRLLNGRWSVDHCMCFDDLYLVLFRYQYVGFNIYFFIGYPVGPV